MKSEEQLQAARRARERGRLAEAAELYGAAGRHLDAAACHRQAGNLARSLHQYLRVAPEDRQYRQACREAVALAPVLGPISLEFENFVAPFIRGGPRDADDVDVFERLGLLYEEQGFPENAREAFQKLLEVRPDHEVAVEACARLGAGSPPVATALPELPELPQIPQPEPLRPTTRTSTNLKAGREGLPAEGPLLTVGARVANRYRLDERIGRGGMAIVFRALDLQLGDVVAVKILTQALDDEEASLRFRRELRLSRQLTHPNVVRLFDIGLHYGFPYISMELLDGSDLQSRMATGRVPPSEGLPLLIQACAGLHAAHQQGIVHRDVKPSNVFITHGGSVKVMDFGIAKIQSAPGLTATGVIAGTPAYMSPEQIRNFSGVTAAADLYALGVVAYEMFTGTLPFKSDDSMGLLLQHLSEAPVPLRRHVASLPEELERVILRLLQKDPARRFTSAPELVQELEAIHVRLGDA